jgi:hypothetical protein
MLEPSILIDGMYLQNALELPMDKVLREVKSEKWGKISALEKKAANIMSQKSKEILKVSFEIVLIILFTPWLSVKRLFMLPRRYPMFAHHGICG